MFFDCKELVNINGTIDMKSCTSYSNMFAGCTNLTAVKLRIMDTFSCSTAFPDFKAIDATNWDTSNVTNTTPDGIESISSPFIPVIFFLVIF